MTAKRHVRRLVGLRRRRVAWAVLSVTYAAAVTSLCLFFRLTELDLIAAETSVAVVALYAGIAPKARRDRVSSVSLADKADDLAYIIRQQWYYEARAQLLNDPYPLPVSWVAADGSVAGAWDAIVNLARHGAGWPTPPPPGTWAASPDDLAGRGGDLPEVLRRVPTSRLVVLGEPGAGKTVLMIRLVMDLLETRLPGGPVPLLASLASWNPVKQDLHGWLAAQITMNYPFMGAAAYGYGRGTCADALVKSGLIMPVLDGLDEIPDAARDRAIAMIDHALRPGEPIVLTCRTEHYLAAARALHGAGEAVLTAAAIQLCPLDPAPVADYLRDSAGGPIEAERWEPVIARLGTLEPVSHVLVTPLMVGLARNIFNPRPGERIERAPDPAQLLTLGTADAVERFLFGAFVPAAFHRRWPFAYRSGRRAERWLRYLAAYLAEQQTRDLAWWELQRAVPAFVAQLADGAISGFGVQAGGDAPPRTTIRVRDLPGSIRGLPILQQLGIGAALSLGAGAMGALTGGMIGLVSGVTAGLVAGLACALPRVLGKLASRIDDPGASIRHDRTVALAAGFAGALLGALLGTFATKLMGGIALGFAGGAALGLLTGIAGTAWGRFQTARAWLALTGQLPWRLVGFLRYAHEVGVMRQNGSLYQFRHALLQDYLARSQADADDPAHAPPLVGEGSRKDHRSSRRRLRHPPASGR